MKCLQGLSVVDVREMSPEEIKLWYQRMAEEMAVEGARRQLIDAIEQNNLVKGTL